ncbi:MULTISPECIES: isoaspartyl peptidase/L-asparaginase family protein [Legionella]|uniref:Isoaspartyl peptidase n=1 Tax=Legionella septentrionalis TaxID=2498109 RepID=A0A3S0VAH6_9GAMM|nr:MULTISPECIES: isoaspartyl peptidase/L-asparaginase [Legionella]MCP0912981.1 isoaspartyl peptidase/L-asparaginase [Legionella sp. 27cVA30]RUQ85326.1 isoaspartyl peptidase/L-asparaginase [Legionella septentrionalis]RUQ96873.1 isoaspartyl peptidase/L-asparaginase [Legionella septentrionalis]RUR10939.1 isoaspartyl peptidase/L-asparaginase [Legionella septentrionalis]RUR15379.1 isoaspartyl peptidase/L-asparaginase [Legionella septentrionalis]
MSKIAFAVHGGASNSYPFLKKNLKEYEEGLAEAAQAGYKILRRGGSALNAVEEGVKVLEDNPIFNAGRGSALNCQGEIEMDASIMDGKTLKAGAVSMVRSVKNPISLARIITYKTKHVFLSGYGALEVARNEGIYLEADSYFYTDHMQEIFRKLSKHETIQKIMEKKIYGTVGAVALDRRGNLAAGTSTGGTSNCLPGRIGDSCVIGAGCYANNKTCAVSGTGEGEYLIRGVIAHTISMMVELKQMGMQEACDYVLHKRHNNRRGHIGVIAINAAGEIGISFNTPIMKRAWISADEPLQVKIFP